MCNKKLDCSLSSHGLKPVGFPAHSIKASICTFVFLSLFVLYPLISYAETPRNGLVHQEDSSDLLSVNDSVIDFIGEYFDDLQYTIYLNFTDNKDGIESNEQKELEYPTERGIYTVKEGMPRNTRHLKEGYWIGAMPSIENIEPMYNHGIRVILTVARTKPSWGHVKRKIDALGIEHIYLPVGSRFPKNDSFHQMLSKHEPNEIFVHCEHGSDRSGAFIAYLLIRDQKWTPQRALLAMVNPSRVDTNGLIQVLGKHGYPVTEDDLFLKGIYSGNSGLKVRNESYRRLVSTMLDALP